MYEIKIKSEGDLFFEDHDDRFDTIEEALDVIKGALVVIRGNPAKYKQVEGIKIVRI